MHVPSDTPDIPAKLRAALGRGPALHVAVLFGSAVSGRMHAGSDVDVGILPVDPALPLREELDLATELSAAVGREVDIVRLDGDDTQLAREIATTAVLLFEATPGAFAAFRAHAIARWIELEETIAPFRARYLERLARQGR